MIKAFTDMDEDNSGQVTRQEYLVAIRTKPEVMTAFVELGLGREANLFDTLNADRSGSITFEQFFDGVMLIMKGHETAKAKDLVGTHLLCQSVAVRVKRICADMASFKAQQDRDATVAAD